MNKNKILSGGGKNLTGGGKWGWRGREVGWEGEGSGVKRGGKWGERGREVGVGYPPVHPLIYMWIGNTYHLAHFLSSWLIHKLTARHWFYFYDKISATSPVTLQNVYENETESEKSTRRRNLLVVYSRKAMRVNQYASRLSMVSFNQNHCKLCALLY